MTVTETLGAIGFWSLKLADDTPDEVLRQLGYFGHIVILRGDVDVSQADPTALLRQARYVGVLRAKPTDARSLEGSGMRFWLGDEDNKGKVREAKLALVSKLLPFCVGAVLPPAVHVGTVNDPGGTYTGNHQWETPRQSLDTITTAFGVEYRVNGDGTVDVGTQAQLYRATPNTILSARGAGADLDVKSIGTDFQPGATAVDYTTRAVLLGQTTDNNAIVEATADAVSVPYLDMFGNPVAFTRMISDSGQTTGSAAAAVQLQLNRFNRLTQAIKVTAEDYDIAGTVVVGDNAWVYDPDNGIFDATRELDFRGEKINPAVVRISAATWPVTREHTVAFRTQAGTVVDLTRWVAWETGTTDLTIGDLPKTLTTGGNPVQDRTNTTPDGTTPNPPSGLSLATSSVQDSKGKSTATISASWTAPSLNTDGSVLTDLSYYLVQYRWQGRAPLWDTRIAPVTSIDIPGLSVGLVYDVEVASVDLTGHVSAFTPVASITAAPDSTAPNPPSDPVVTSYLGQLRIAWDGKDNTGAAMPPDFAVVEVHVSATSGFVPDSSPGSATLVSQLATAGVAYATAPYGAGRFVKLVAVDNSGNRSSPSGQVSGTTTQVADGDVASLSVGKLTAGTMAADVVVAGRFATALTGARVEMNSLGFQKFDVDGVTKLISLTGTEALLTGVYKSAASGRRVEIGAGGSLGEVDFYAPDGTQTFVRAFTESSGVESIQLGMPAVGTTSFLWNKVHINSDEWMELSANKVDTTFGKASGFFIIRHTTDKRQGAGNTAARLLVDGTSLTYWDPDSNPRLAINPTSGFIYWDPLGNPRLHIVDGTGGDVWFQWADTNKRVLLRPDTVSPDGSAQVQLVNPHSYGVTLRNASTAAGSNSRLDVLDATASAYEDIWGGAYTNASSLLGKAEVATAQVDARAKLRGVRAITFRRKGRKGADGRPAELGATELGLAAQEVPPEMQTWDQDGVLVGINTSAQAAMTLAYLQQVDERVEQLAAAVAAVTRELGEK